MKGGKKSTSQPKDKKSSSQKLTKQASQSSVKEKPNTRNTR